MCGTTEIACNLSPEKLRSRTDLASQLGASSLLDVSTTKERAELTFSSSPEVEQRIQTFVESEKACCPFFDFSISHQSEGILLTISAPEDGIAMTRGLIAGFTSGWSLT